MQPGEFSTHLRMIRVLQAEESLRRVSEVAAGSGLMKDADRRPIIERWRRDANMLTKTKRRLTLDQLIGNGIGLRFKEKAHAG